MSNPKKKTPLQEAICEIDRLALNKADTKEGLHMLALIKNYIKGTLLPEEKQFAEEGSGKEDQLSIEDYKEVFEDHKRLVRELDVLINRKNAAKQASLCDIVAQLRKERIFSLNDMIECWEASEDHYAYSEHNRILEAPDKEQYFKEKFNITLNQQQNG